MSRGYMWDGELVLPSPLYRVPRLVAVYPNEVTCLGCGQTSHPKVNGCPRCSNDTDGVNFDDDGKKAFVETETVPTISYLREDEYYYVK